MRCGSIILDKNLTHHVVVEGLVVEEELGQEAEVLAVQLVLLPVHLVAWVGKWVDGLMGRLVGGLVCTSKTDRSSPHPHNQSVDQSIEARTSKTDR